MKNMTAKGWNSNAVPVNQVPRGRASCISPIKVKVAIMLEVVKQANGIGVPSKYLDFPDSSFGSIATVTLNRANLVNPQST
jgi:hypothetical protein